MAGRSITHGMTGTKTYATWGNMIQRCTNPNNHKYDYYLGKGVSVCDSWKRFENFYSDIGEIPDGMSLERVDVDGDYCPENCILIPIEKQSCNRSNTVYVEHNGESVRLADLARMYGIPYKAMHLRYKRGDTGEKLVRPLCR